MRVVALLGVRNEELYIGRCLEHLLSQGIEVCVIDNDSSDQTVAIAEQYLRNGVIQIAHVAYQGSFELLRLLEFKAQLAQKIDADWFIHHDCDEIREAPRPYQTLLEGIQEIDQAGYNAINFDEFVFIPTDENESYLGRDYVHEMEYYYFFSPRPIHRLNAWKKLPTPVDLTRSGGHLIRFPGINIAPTHFILRHYPILSAEHASMKYGGRKFPKSEILRGWHADRALFRKRDVRLPQKSELKRVSNDGTWDRSDPWASHPFLPDRDRVRKITKRRKRVRNFIKRVTRRLKLG
ncbi:MAG: glycosyltransferase family 2 protein [Anaerolineales bacterium]|nr:glycosyltransferase family 2 protein [Anaerolineales bacterium]